MAPKIGELNASLPLGYRIVVGGTAEESGKSQASLLAVVPLMLFLMLTVLMIQLQGFTRLFLVLSVVPLGLIGVVAALLASGKPLGFVAILGVLALVGMIARNSVVLIDQDRDRKGAWAASLGCGYRGHDAPLPTHPAHSGGGDPRNDPDCPNDFLGPDGLRHHAGLAIATLLTLVFLPALYVAWFRIQPPDADAHTDAETGLGEPAMHDGKQVHSV